jgi:hypothetical protein
MLLFILLASPQAWIIGVAALIIGGIYYKAKAALE